MSKTRIFWIILERLVSQRFFDRPKNYFSELLYIQSNFPCERHFLARGSQKEVKGGVGGGRGGGGGNHLSFPIKW